MRADPSRDGGFAGRARPGDGEAGNLVAEVPRGTGGADCGRGTTKPPYLSFNPITNEQTRFKLIGFMGVLEGEKQNARRKTETIGSVSGQIHSRTSA